MEQVDGKKERTDELELHELVDDVNHQEDLHEDVQQTLRDRRKLASDYSGTVETSLYDFEDAIESTPPVIVDSFIESKIPG